MVSQVDLLTIEEYVRLYEQDGPFEIIDGERKPIVPPVSEHGWVLRALFRLLDAFCLQHDLGQVFTEMPFVLVYDANRVKGSRVPDLMFFSRQKWETYIETEPDWKKKPFVLVPDLAVEVVSPNDVYTDIQNKVAHYIGDGVQLIWIIDPNHQTVATYAGTQYHQLTAADVLTGEDVLPGLHINVKDLFAS